jgi:hypothetical protein
MESKEVWKPDWNVQTDLTCHKDLQTFEVGNILGLEMKKSEWSMIARYTLFV